LDAGYTLKVISGNGATAVFDDSRVKMNDNIIVAAELNGAPLPEAYWPLALVGSDVSSQEAIKNISQMQITLDNPPSLFPSQSSTPPSSTTIPSSSPSMSPTALPNITPSPSPTTTPPPTTLPEMTLTVVGSTGTQKTLRSNDIAALTTYSAYGGTRSSSGTLANFANYTGVPILNLCNLVGGVTSSNTVRVSASDDYSVTYSYAQMNGEDITTYDSAGNQVTPSQPLTMIVAYYQNGTGLPSGVGPLRIMIVGPEGLYTSGSLNARLVVKIEVLN
jgi:DMSO/TMAO reductase YedYZ molybdopterin-dependent catalytic subunit